MRGFEILSFLILWQKARIVNIVATENPDPSTFCLATTKFCDWNLYEENRSCITCQPVCSMTLQKVDRCTNVELKACSPFFFLNPDMILQSC